MALGRATYGAESLLWALAGLVNSTIRNDTDHLACERGRAIP
jgi:hypothetical protein